MARDILPHVATHFSFGTPIYAGLSERQVADLYAMLARLFPPGDDVERSGKFISQFDSIGYLRDGAPRYLAGMGTAAAVKALSGLITDHPAFSSLTYDLSLAERAMRIATWSPLTPKEVLALADWPDLQLVMSSVDLLGTLVTALEKYAAALHGAQTPIMDLWDEQHREHTFRHRFPPYFP